MAVQPSMAVGKCLLEGERYGGGGGISSPIRVFVTRERLPDTGSPDPEFSGYQTSGFAPGLRSHS